MIEQLLQTALSAVQDGRPVMLVSVVRATGSTPRAAGALITATPRGYIVERGRGGLRVGGRGLRSAVRANGYVVVYRFAAVFAKHIHIPP